MSTPLPLLVNSPSYWSPSGSCPRLFLAPMEGLGDRCFRQSMAYIGGFDEACTEFLRVPKNAYVPSLAKRYHSQEMQPFPMAAQIMGEDPELMAAMTQELANRGAPRIDLNCGCPSNTVTGRGAGSSLLKDPEHLHRITRAMVEAVDIPVTAKLRSGFNDTSLFRENLLAAQESGISFLTLHPRTRAEQYGPPARWDLLAEAKEILRIPLVGNGDILCAEDALKMRKETGCDAFMVGRGAVRNPWIFHEIRRAFGESAKESSWSETEAFIRHYFRCFPDDMRERTRVNKLKQLSNYLFRFTPLLEEKRQDLLRTASKDSALFLQELLTLLHQFGPWT